MIRQMVKKTARALGYDLRRFSPGVDSSNEIYQLLQQVVRPVIFDVGAHHGQTARAFTKSFPSAELYCFEPFPESFAELKRNSSDYPAATLEPIGFSDSGGNHEFNSNESSPTNSLLPLDSRAAATWGNSALIPVQKMLCNFETLDDYLDRKAIQQIHLLKMDVQGAEYKVLKGAEISLRANRILNIYMEILIEETYLGQFRFGDYLNLMESFGFRLQGLFNLEHGSDRQIVQLDGLFSKK
jgi:FkbM family methyltransferase